MTTPCPQCGHEIEIGQYPYCPHGWIHERNAQRFETIVVWQSNSDAEKFSFPGQANEPAPEGYHKIEITNIRQADQFVARMNGIERRKLEAQRDQRYALDDAGVKQRRYEEDVLGRLRGNTRAENLQRRVREWADKLRERRRGQHPRIDPQFHINVLSFDSGNRNSYSGPETGWREKKS
jgi:hypothetical protein